MQIFAGGWVRDTLTKLGASEDKPIERSMVSRRITEAQKKIESQSSGDFPAASAEEWLEKNRPKRASKGE